MVEYLEKDEFKNLIEQHICKYCAKYNRGSFSNNCAICKISQVYSCIALTTPYIFNPTDEITIKE